MPPKKKLLDYEFKGLKKDKGTEAIYQVAEKQAVTRKRGNRLFHFIRRKKHKGQQAKGLLPYLIVPKGKRLTRRVILKLDKENARYRISRAVDAAKKLKDYAKCELKEIFFPFDKAEKEWKSEAKESYSQIQLRKDQIDRIRQREIKRRKKVEQTIQAELRRRRYRISPEDPNYSYIAGYQKDKHRITKKRFMTCVNVKLWNEILSNNTRLMNSPLWDPNINFDTLTVKEARLMKRHLKQFEVIVEALKQGLLDNPGIERVPVKNVRRLRQFPGKGSADEQGQQDYSEKILRLSKYKHNNAPKRVIKGKTRHPKKIKEFPPYEDAKVEGEEDPVIYKKPEGWFDKVKAWILENPAARPKPETEKYKKHKLKHKKDGIISKAKSFAIGNRNKINIYDPETTEGNKGGGGRQTMVMYRKSSATAAITADYRISLLERMSKLNFNPFAHFLTIKVPKELIERKNLIHALTETKIKKPENTKKPDNETERKEDLDVRKSYEERRDPIQRLHQDEKDSDIWTKSDSTTTDDYASWRRVPAAVKKKQNRKKGLKNSVYDQTFAFKIILMSIILWEIGAFVKRVLDEVYYNILTFHLFRENIWVTETRHISTPDDNYIFILLEEWAHLFVSFMSLSIYKTKNECISIPFAFSLLIHSIIDIAKYSHDKIIAAEEGVSIKTLLFLIFNSITKAIRICLFIAYHYHCADYIRKSREFRHRKTKLHNHEINAKGTKGLNKRRLAWDWMTRHCRVQALNALKKKYPDVKDGNYPENELNQTIKFVEEKEMRLYAQEHNLNLGYPYNSLKDMKRYIFEESEASEYTESEVEEELRRMDRRNQRYAKRKSTPPLTFEMYKKWRREQYKVEKTKKIAVIEEPVREVVKEEKPKKNFLLTIGPKLPKDFARDSL